MTTALNRLEIFMTETKEVSGVNKKLVTYHIIFWLAYFFLNYLRWGHYFGDYGYSFRSNLVEFPIHILLVYFNLNYLLPKLVPGKLLLYIGSILLATFGFSILRIIITYELVTTEIWRESIIEQSELFNTNYIIAVFIGEIYVVGLTMAVKLTYDWIRSRKLAQDLMEQHHETQLSFLRSQMQPHFFFNTLNNLYSLTLDKSDKAPDIVLKLSELMSYVVYRGKNKQVKLMEEIQLLQNYLDLERLRYGDNIEVEFEITGNLEDKDIPPLILLPFVENCFKHGSKGSDGIFRIKIAIHSLPGSLAMHVANDIGTDHLDDQQFKLDNPEGIGIENTKKRLNLLYESKYSLEIRQEQGIFKVDLKIPV